MKQEKMILNTSDEAAKHVTGIEGWVDVHGRFWGKDERMARWSSCTHIECSVCGKPTHKNYTVCQSCRSIKESERYQAMERKQWDGEEPLYSDSYDEYFFDLDSLYDYMVNHDCDAESLRLIICEPNYLRQLEGDYFYDELPEDGELADEVEAAMKAFNKVIQDQGPASWFPSKYAADYDFWKPEGMKLEVMNGLND